VALDAVSLDYTATLASTNGTQSDLDIPKNIELALCKKWRSSSYESLAVRGYI